MTRTLLAALLALGVVGGTALIPALGWTSASARGVAAEPTAEPVSAVNQTDEYPPGVSSEGVTDPLALADAHRDALANVSYTMTTTFTFQRPNGSILSQGTSTSQVAAGSSSYYAVSAQTEWNDTRPLGVGGYELAAWANETDAVTARQFYDEEPTYRQTTRADAPMKPDTEWGQIYAALSATNTTVASQFEDDGTTLYRVVSTDQPGENSPYSGREVYSFVAVVDSQGVVRTMQVTYRTTFRDEPAIVSRTIHVTNLGNTTVERPDWYGKAAGNESDTESA